MVGLSFHRVARLELRQPNPCYNGVFFYLSQRDPVHIPALQAVFMPPEDAPEPNG